LTSLIQQAEEKIHHEGGRMTTQRRLVLTALENCCDHPSAEDIYEHARQSDSSINLSTVYRTLHWLEENGLVSPRHFADHRHLDRFDPLVEKSIEHAHFRCSRCGKITEFSVPQLEKIKQTYAAGHGAQIDRASLTLYGICRECQEKDNPDE